MKTKLDRIAVLYTLLAGACDGLTGILLLAAPVFTLNWMGIGALPSEPVYMQWIGAFVFSVGASYFLPALPSNPETRRRRFLGVLEITTGIRLVIAAFTGFALLQGTLDPAWITVTLTDLTLAAIQITLLKLGAFRAGEK